MSEDSLSDEELQYMYEREENYVEPQNVPTEFKPGVVSGLQQCQSSEVNKLCIFDIQNKLKETDKYDIGATYTNDEPDLSFYHTTTNFHSERYILNLFVCHHTIGSFKLRISDEDSLPNKNQEIKIKSHSSCMIFPGTLKSKVFSSSEIHESHYIRSFYFSKSNLENIQNLYIPIEIEMNVNFIINENVLTWVKENHNKSLFNVKENTDLTIISSNGTKYNTHKLLLAIQSPVLKEKVKKNKTDSISLDINDDEINLFFEFIYKNTICDIENKDWQLILNLADKFDIDSLKKLIQVPMSQQITIDNAVNIAILSEKYELIDIQEKIIDFIKQNPKVLDTESWNDLNDVVLTKKILKGICTSTK